MQVDGAAAAPGAHDSMVREFDDSPAGSRAARHFVEDACRRWGHLHMVEEAALVVTELTTNAVRHARSAFVVALSSTPTGLRIAVSDASPAPPVPRRPDLLDTGGRGLALIAAVATAWGVDLLDDGKVVWAEL